MHKSYHPSLASSLAGTHSTPTEAPASSRMPICLAPRPSLTSPPSGRMGLGIKVTELFTLSLVFSRIPLCFPVQSQQMQTCYRLDKRVQARGRKEARCSHLSRGQIPPGIHPRYSGIALSPLVITAPRNALNNHTIRKTAIKQSWGITLLCIDVYAPQTL